MKKESGTSTEDFYNSLAKDYHLVYQDWDVSIKRQSKVIHQLIQKYFGQQPNKVLDCTCGIGTQALGLSEMGYEVHGTDISSASIERAQAEAKKRLLPVTFQVVDIRQLTAKVKGQFDTIISFDNSLPHLRDHGDFLLAAKHIKAKLNPKGVVLGSTRDYDLLLREKPSSTKPITSTIDGIKTITFQLWDWKPDNTYVVNHFTLKELNNEFETSVRKTEYAAYSRAEMTHIFSEAGFNKIDWLMPKESGFYQPIFIVRP